MSVEMINNIIGIRVNDYKEYIGIGSQNMRKEDEPFLSKCAISEISKEKVKRMFHKKPELRELLLKIYNNTIIKRAEYIDNELTEVYETIWFDKAMQLVEMYEGCVNVYMLLNLINTIAAAQPYSYYSEYFEEKDIAGEDVNFVELLAMKNIYASSTGLNKDSINSIAQNVSEKISNIFPEAISYGSMSNKLEQMQSELASLEQRKGEIIQETSEEKEKLDSFVRELESQEAKLKEQAEQEMKDKYEELKAENERLRAKNSRFRGEDNKKSELPKSKKSHLFMSRKQRINYILSMMVDRKYTPERIRLIRTAIDKGVRLGDIEDIIEKNVDTGILRESIEILTAETTSEKGGK